MVVNKIETEKGCEKKYSLYFALPNIRCSESTIYRVRENPTFFFSYPNRLTFHLTLFTSFPFFLSAFCRFLSAEKLNTRPQAKFQDLRASVLYTVSLRQSTNFAARAMPLLL